MISSCQPVTGLSKCYRASALDPSSGAVAVPGGNRGQKGIKIAKSQPRITSLGRLFFQNFLIHLAKLLQLQRHHRPLTPFKRRQLAHTQLMQ